MPGSGCVAACVTVDRRARSVTRALHFVVSFGSLPANEGAGYVDTAADIPSLMRLMMIGG